MEVQKLLNPESDTILGPDYAQTVLEEVKRDQEFAEEVEGYQEMSLDDIAARLLSIDERNE